MSTELIQGLARAHPAWPHFVKQMEGRQYSAHDTENVWYWFQRGWDESLKANPPLAPQGGFPFNHD